jgi:lysophospholipase L1-like esterase
MLVLRNEDEAPLDDVDRVADGGVLVEGGVPGSPSRGDAEAGDEADPLAEANLPQRPVAPAEVEFDVDSVVVVGDSITEASAAAIEANLSSEGVETVEVHGKARRRIEVGAGNSEQPLSGIKEMYQLIRDGVSPDVWVIALGTNDVAAYAGEEDYGRLVDTVLGMIPQDVPVVWVDVYRPKELRHTEMFNDVLHDRLDDREHAAIAPWNAFASSPDLAILRDDRLHPNATGSEVFAAVIASAIDAALD